MTDLASLARTGDLDDKRIVGYLDTLDVPELTSVLNAPEVRTVIFTVPGGLWSPGQPKPGLADDDPAVNAAMARCATSRWRGSHVFGDLAVTEMHAERCGWCDYPAEELQRALEWGAHYGRFITDESYVWTRSHAVYRRASGRAGRYENGRWAAFAALSPKEQRYQVDRAVEASRANLDPVERPQREHPPWCDLRDDHDGECPEPPA